MLTINFWLQLCMFVLSGFVYLLSFELSSNLIWFEGDRVTEEHGRNQTHYLIDRQTFQPAITSYRRSAFA